MKLKIGLTSEEVLKHRQIYGANVLPEKKLKSAWDFVAETFKDKLNLILVAMLIVFTILAVAGQGSLSEPLGIFVVLLAITIISTRTGLKSQRSTKELKDKTSHHTCKVLRDGAVVTIDTEELVVGDVVFIESGEAIYADGYLAEGNVSVDNSVLNGESKECKKSAIPDFEYIPKETITGDDYVDQNSLFAGAVVLDGVGKMVVTAVGVNTVNGETITEMNDIEETKTSLEIQLDELAETISKFGTVAAIFIAMVSLMSNIAMTEGFFTLGWLPILNKVLTIITTSLTIVVAAVPEGLPLIISLITAQNAKRMLDHNVLAKHTNKIPEAGNIQLLCTDKTGTLTKGVLEPVYNITLDGDEIKFADEVVRCRFVDNICINSNAMFDENGKVIGGNATERALLGMVDAEVYKECNCVTINNRKSFNSANKYSAVEIIDCDGGCVTYYKGAPEKLLAVAKKYMTATGDIADIDTEATKQTIAGFTTKAMRVIATGYSMSRLGENLPDDMIITSLVAIRDDVREEVPDAVERMHKAGVQVMMVTGDVIDTARAIAVDSKIIKSEKDIAMSAVDFDQLSDKEAKRELPNIKVIARATPQTKLRIVRLAQELGLCVAMTGV